MANTSELTAALRGALSRASVIVCVGHELAGDDAAGPLVARALAGKLPWPLYDARTVPENFLMKIAGHRPEVVLLIDAIDLGLPPGSVRLLEAADITGQGPSTHGPAPIAFLDLLNMVHPCRRLVLGIQPRQTQFGQPPSPEVVAAVDRVAQALVQAGQRLSL